jgi:hypothetical protein
MSLSVFGKWIASVQDDVLDRRERHVDDISAVRRELFDAAPARVRSGFSWMIPSLAVVSAAAALFVVIFLVNERTEMPAAVSAPVAIRTAPAGNNWISVTEEAGRVVRFADQSTVALQQGANARVLSEKEHAVHFLLEQGSARVQVVHFSDTRWRMDVGPYKVDVIGTTFDISWDPDARFFQLSLIEGKVEVFGPMISDGRLISTKETFRSWVGEGRVEISSDDNKNVLADDVGAAPESCAKGNRVPSVDRRPAGSPSLPEESWADLNRRGRFAQVLAEAESRGLTETMAERSAADLLALADAARLLRNWDIAFASYNALRERFRGTGSAATAAYSMGRIYFDHRGDYASAARWLETYLRESGDVGTLQREALGRLVEACQKSGDIAGAQASAKKYLARYPGGPHAGIAASVLSN